MHCSLSGHQACKKGGKRVAVSSGSENYSNDAEPPRKRNQVVENDGSPISREVMGHLLDQVTIVGQQAIANNFLLKGILNAAEKSSEVQQEMMRWT